MKKEYDKETRKQILQKKIAWQAVKNHWKILDGNGLVVHQIYEQIPELEVIYQTYLSIWQTMTPTEKIPISIKGEQRYQEIAKKMHLEIGKQYYVKWDGWVLIELTNVQTAVEQLWNGGEGFLLLDTQIHTIKDVDMDSGDEYHISIYIWDFGQIDEQKYL